MHILGGILLIVVVFGFAFFVYTSGVLQPVFGPVLSGLGIQNASTTPASNNSQYFGEVDIQFVSLGSGLNQPQILSLKGRNAAAHAGIVLTGWSLKTNKGTYYFPRVANLYSPSVPGVPPEDIYLRSGGTINFYSGKNPQGNQQAIRSGLAEWQLWLGEEFLSSPHGEVALRDEKGKIVDDYKY
jgi:hypothetical protein